MSHDSTSTLPPHHITSDGNTRIITVSDWSIKSVKRPILKAADAQNLSDELDLPLPEICFGYNSLIIEHSPSGFSYEFTTPAALRGVDPTGQNEYMVKVSYADHWAKTRGSDNMKVVKPFDWTYTTTYQGHSSHSSPFAEPSSEHNGLPMHHIARKDPILFFEEVPLFEDELHDNGMASFSVKVRVMPSCWFVLARFFLRVDGVIFRIYDTRLFHLFGSSEVIREVKGREASYDFIKQRLPPEKPHDLTPLTDENWVAQVMGMLGVTENHRMSERKWIGEEHRTEILELSKGTWPQNSCFT